MIELNGDAFHSDKEGRARDEARDLRLEREGWEVIRLRSGWVFRRPTEFVAAVQDILRPREPRRRAALAARRRRSVTRRPHPQPSQGSTVTFSGFRPARPARTGPRTPGPSRRGPGGRRGPSRR
ncbi:hypothetical protein [Propioniciclava sp.]|uniref:hypothetical protein n=1 Tax=Propioniciclava sp. TaxID=2038686 RepID=UPI003450E01A